MSEDGYRFFIFGNSSIRERILTLLLVRQGKRLHLREIARQVGTSAGTASRELKRLLDAGAVIRTVEGRQVYYERSPKGILWEAPAAWIGRHRSIRETLKRELEGLPGIESAAIYGSYPTGHWRPESDIDLFIVGSPDRDELTDRLERAQNEIGRPVNEVVMSATELAARRARNDGFIRSVDNGQKVELLP